MSAITVYVLSSSFLLYQKIMNCILITVEYVQVKRQTLKLRSTTFHASDISKPLAKLLEFLLMQQFKNLENVHDN